MKARPWLPACGGGGGVVRGAHEDGAGYDRGLTTAVGCRLPSLDLEWPHLAGRGGFFPYGRLLVRLAAQLVDRPTCRTLTVLLR